MNMLKSYSIRWQCSPQITLATVIVWHSVRVLVCLVYVVHIKQIVLCGQQIVISQWIVPTMTRSTATLRIHCDSCECVRDFRTSCLPLCMWCRRVGHCIYMAVSLCLLFASLCYFNILGVCMFFLSSIVKHIELRFTDVEKQRHYSTVANNTSIEAVQHLSMYLRVFIHSALHIWEEFTKYLKTSRIYLDSKKYYLLLIGF